MSEVVQLSSSPNLSQVENNSLVLIQKYASRIFRLIKGTGKVGLTGVSLAIPAVFAFDPQTRGYLSQDMTSVLAGGLVGTVSLLAGGVFAKKNLEDLDHFLADRFGHEPIFMRAARMLSRRNLEKIRDNPEIPLASVLFDYRNYHAFLPDDFSTYYAGEEIPEDIELMVERVLETLGYYPKTLLEKHIGSVLIREAGSLRTEEEDMDIEKELAGLPDSLRMPLIEGLKSKQGLQKESFVLGRAKRGQKNITISEKNTQRENVGGTMHHEVSHMILLHTITHFYEKIWKDEFGERQVDQTEYADHPLFGTDINYGTLHSYEDMATIAQNMFSKSGWEELYKMVRTNQKYGKRPGIFMRKVLRMKEFYFKVSHGLMDDEYFRAIEEGSIRSWQDAQEYFKNNE